MTYALSIHVESYEFSGEFYLVGDGCSRGGEVLKHVATDHILAMKQRPHTAESLLGIVQFDQISRRGKNSGDK